MIKGIIKACIPNVACSEGSEAIITIALRNQDRDEIALDAVLDTGFSDYLAMPKRIIDGLGLTFLTTINMINSDQQVSETRIYEGGSLRWNDGWRRIKIQEIPGGQILAGMALLYSSDVHLSVARNGWVEVNEKEVDTDEDNDNELEDETEVELY